LKRMSDLANQADTIDSPGEPPERRQSARPGDQPLRAGTVALRKGHGEEVLGRAPEKVS
jgi:hypothetical protein